MSASGQKLTWALVILMSPLPSGADILRRFRHVFSVNGHKRGTQPQSTLPQSGVQNSFSHSSFVIGGLM
jgi:hypothetical protein